MGGGEISKYLSCGNIISFLWEQNIILREYYNMLWEQDNVLWEQANILMEQDNLFVTRVTTQGVSHEREKDRIVIKANFRKI
jgi:hypothetical protein